MTRPIPKALRDRGIKELRHNIAPGQALCLQSSVVMLFFGEALTQRLIKKAAHGHATRNT